MDENNSSKHKQLPKNKETQNYKGLFGVDSNLPTQVTINNGSENGSIHYVYDATGMKLEKKVVKSGASDVITSYAGNYIYKDSNLEFFNHAEGYVTKDGSGYNYVYQYKDHLGNIRLSYQDANQNNDTKPVDVVILDEKNYYPFGLQHRGYNDVVNGTENNYKQFQAQEWTEDLGLNTHEWKYRVSDPAIGRFWQIDPLAEQYNYQSPYNFAENRVIDGFELEGLEWVDTDDGWQYQGYDYGPSPVPQNAIGIAPEGSRPVASWVSQEPRGVPFTGTVSTLNVGGPDGTVQQFSANANGMVELPHSGTEQTGLGTSGTYEIDGHTVYGYYNRNDVANAVEDQWGTPENISNMINAITEFDIQTLLDNPIQIGDMRSPTDGRVNIDSRRTHHGDTGAFDIRLIGNNGGLPAGSSVNDRAFSTQNTQIFINALGNNGFNRFLIGPNALPNLNNSGTTNVVNGGNEHNDHYHVDNRN